MKLQEYGKVADRNLDSFLKQILDWSKQKVSIQDNLDVRFVTAYIGTTETEVKHTLGRIPAFVIPVAAYPNGTSTIDFAKASTIEAMYLKRGTAGTCSLLIF